MKTYLDQLENRIQLYKHLLKLTFGENIQKRTISYLGEETARTLAHLGTFQMVQQILLALNCYTFVYMYIIALYANKFVVEKK